MAGEEERKERMAHEATLALLRGMRADLGVEALEASSEALKRVNRSVEAEPRVRVGEGVGALGDVHLLGRVPKSRLEQLVRALREHSPHEGVSLSLRVQKPRFFRRKLDLFLHVRGPPELLERALVVWHRRQEG